MAKNTNLQLLKEPVRLRVKKLTNGVQSLYLDSYHDGKRSYEFLKLYLLPGKSETIKAQNEATLTAAKTIKIKRILEYTNNRAGLRNTAIRSKITLRQWMETFRLRQEKNGVKDQKNIHKTICALTKYNIDIQMRDIDRKYCIGLINFLRNDFISYKGTHIQGYTILNYLGCLRNALNMAVREDVIPSNPLYMLSPQERVKAPETQRSYLTIEEVQRLEVTPCKHELEKRAFLFSCYCGLRISDVRKLKWSDLIYEGDQCHLNIVMQKTRTPLYLPLSKKALRWIPDQIIEKPDAPLFPKLQEWVDAKHILKPWMNAAGITKPITFHSSRHTYATMLLTLGVDIYTVSKLLGHRRIETTQIYAKIVNKKRDEAAELIDNAFERMQAAK